MNRDKVREVLERYKKKIHGSEYDFHCKKQTLEEHNAYMTMVQGRATNEIMGMELI